MLKCLYCKQNWCKVPPNESGKAYVPPVCSEQCARNLAQVWYSNEDPTKLFWNGKTRIKIPPQPTCVCGNTAPGGCSDRDDPRAYYVSADEVKILDKIV
jgi:hypothetical protein